MDFLANIAIWSWFLTKSYYNSFKSNILGYAPIDSIVIIQ